MLTYEAAQKGYAKMWSSIAVKSGKDSTNATFFAKLIIKGEAQYKAVEARTGVPWFFVGALHMRESGCDFKGVLHNGEKIIGTQRKTKLVPAGRGPFKTWIDAAIDAIKLKYTLYLGREWCPALMGYVSEGFNGWGYIGKGVNSPYVWAGSNHEQTGKYVADHVWDKNFDDPQIGTMTVLKRLSELRPDVAEALAENHKAPMSNTTKTTIGTAGGVVVAGGAAASSSDTLNQLQPIIDIFQQHGTTIGLVFTVAIIIGVVGWHFYEKAQTADAVP
jgi:lysozyme family protein